MTDATLVLLPYATGSAIELGNRQWRKLLLPVGEIRYKGSVLKFTRDYLTGLADAFRQHAYDQVPFQAAPDDNSHSNDPHRFRGQVTDMAVDPAGLWITMEPTEAGEQLLRENPNLGVSARIVEGYDRSDGRHFPAAIQHVLGTLDPRIPGMGGWEPIEASNDYASGGSIIDLSGLAFEGTSYLTDETPAEVAAVDQILAELEEMETEAADYGMTLAEWEAVIADGAELSNQMGAIELAGSDDISWQSNEDLIAEMDALGRDMSQARSPISLSNSDPLTTELARVDGELTARAEAGRAYWQSEAARPARATTDQRLASALQRIGDGTYLPSRHVAFTSDSQREILLSQLRESQDFSFSDVADGQLSYGLPCGPLDEYGRCRSSFHDLSCSSSAVIAPESVEAYKEDLRLTAMLPANPESDATFSDHIEAASGQRLSHEGFSLFETGPGARRGANGGTYQREAIRIGTRQVHGDPDADEGERYDYEPAPGTHRTVAQYVRQAGLERPHTSREARIADQALRAEGRPRRMSATSPLRDEDFAPRRERSVPAGSRGIRQLEDTESMSGSLPVMTRG